MMDDSRTDRLAREFCDGTLPREEWTHQAHLRVGLWHLLRDPPDVALTHLRDRISRYNVGLGNVNTPTMGYHETITRFYVWAIANFLRSADRDQSLDTLAERLISSCGEKDFPFRYYSRDRLLSSEARLGWVEPDLAPLEPCSGTPCPH